MAPPNQAAGGSSESSLVVTVDVTAARDLLAGDGGHRYLDVRTEEELSRLGRPVVDSKPFLNVPYMFITPQGKQASATNYLYNLLADFA
nr:unnamed protein product [Digitaria exilis]CAB3448480.1 unnamed protein product [Digitaria exilis]